MSRLASSRPFALAALAGLCVVTACRAPAVVPSRFSSSTAHPELPAPAPVPRVVLQRRSGASLMNHLVTPTRVWELVRENGLTFVDVEKNVDVATLSTPYWPSDFAFTPDGQDVVIVSFDPRPVRDGVWHPPTGSEQRIVERYHIATRTRRFSRPLPLMPVENRSISSETVDHVTASARGIFVTRCYVFHQNICTVQQLGALDGALGAIETFAASPVPMRWGPDRIDAKGGRFSLRRQSPWSNPPLREASRFSIFDDQGKERGFVGAVCARFDEHDQLWLDGAVDSTLSAVHVLGIKTQKGARACGLDFVKQPRLTQAIPQRAFLNLVDYSWPAIVEDRILWQIPYLASEVRSLDITTRAMPARVELPALNGQAPDKAWSLHPQIGPEVYASLGKRFARFVEGAFVPEPGQLPHEGRLASQADALLLSNFKTDTLLFLALGVRKQPAGPFEWRDIAAESSFAPGFVSIDQNGERLFAIAGGRKGIQIVDAATGRLTKRICGSAADERGDCADRSIGLLRSKDGKRVFTFRDSREPGKGPEERHFIEVEVATGKTLRTFRAPQFTFASPDNYRMGWLEPDRRFFFAARLWFSHQQTCAVVVGLPAAANEAASYESWCVSGRSIGLREDPKGRFIAAFRGIDGVEFMTSSGEQVLTVSARGNDAVAFTPDGRFACTGAACDGFRCIVGDEVRAATDAACASLRVGGFSLLEELARSPSRAGR